MAKVIMDVPYPFGPEAFSSEGIVRLSEETVITAPGAPLSPPLMLDTGLMEAIPDPGAGWHVLDLPAYIAALPAKPCRLIIGTLYVYNVNDTGRPWKIFVRPYGVTSYFWPVTSALMELTGQDLFWPLFCALGNEGKIEINVNDDGSGGFAAMTGIVTRVLIHARLATEDPD